MNRTFHHTAVKGAIVLCCVLYFFVGFNPRVLCIELRRF